MIGAVPVQVPLLTLSVWPSVKVPVIAGATVLLGSVGGGGGGGGVVGPPLRTGLIDMRSSASEVRINRAPRCRAPW